jgi:hypothetical protein
MGALFRNWNWIKLFRRAFKKFFFTGAIDHVPPDFLRAFTDAIEPVSWHPLRNGWMQSDDVTILYTWCMNDSVNNWSLPPLKTKPIYRPPFSTLHKHNIQMVHSLLGQSLNESTVSNSVLGFSQPWPHCRSSRRTRNRQRIQWFLKR